MKTTLWFAAVAAIGWACSGDAEFEVATYLRPLLDSSMAHFRVAAGDRV